MNVNRILQIRNGDAAKTFRDFLAAWWRRVELDAMLAPVEMPDHAGVLPQLISHPDDLSNVNPFIPVMLTNSASMVEEFVRDHPRSHLAVILRPCELRALVELKKRNRVHYQSVSSNKGGESLVILSVDCPGTFSLNEYAQHVASHQDDTEMIRVKLAYGRQNSYVPYQVRPACQLCDSPSPVGADIIIGTIGVAPEGNLLVIARDEKTDAKLRLGEVTADIASERQVVYREVMVGKLVDKRAQERSQLLQAHSHDEENMNAYLAFFARCTLCADCLDACPLYDGELTGMLGVGEGHQGPHALLSEIVNLSRWLASCSGCGMCQEACEHQVALSSVITTLSHRIQNQLHYRPGDPTQRLPWMT